MCDLTAPKDGLVHSRRLIHRHASEYIAVEASDKSLQSRPNPVGTDSPPQSFDGCYQLAVVNGLEAEFVRSQPLDQA
ncbi:hypothetical protein D3C80_1744240 [compost metagenome]